MSHRLHESELRDAEQHARDEKEMPPRWVRVAMACLVAELRTLRAENKALRTALIQVCTDACTGADDRRRTWAIREAANDLSEPFSWEKAQRVYDEVTYHRLESDDRKALRYVVMQMNPSRPWGNPQGHRMHTHNRALAVLDRLIGGAK